MSLLRCSALQTGYENRVRVLFTGDRESPPVYGLEMDRETYRAIPLLDPATPDTFRAIAAENGHRAVLECPANFLDIYARLNNEEV